MPSAPVSVLGHVLGSGSQALPAAGPDLTNYFVVCASAIGVLLAFLWIFRRFVAERLKARAARRSMQVLDVLPISGKQKLVVVRCYDRTFLLGVGEKEMRAITELDAASEPPPPLPRQEQDPRRFSAALADELALLPARPRAATAGSDARGGILA